MSGVKRKKAAGLHQSLTPFQLSILVSLCNDERFMEPVWIVNTKRARPQALSDLVRLCSLGLLKDITKKTTKYQRSYEMTEAGFLLFHTCEHHTIPVC